MKILLAVMISTVMASSAYAACASDKLGDCKEKSTCEGLSKDAGLKYEFNEGAKKCMVKDVKVSSTDCISGVDSNKGKGVAAATESEKAKATGTTTK